MIPANANAILEELEQKNAQVLNLLGMCRTERYEAVWNDGPRLCRRFARLLLKQGHPTLALEVAARGLDRYSLDPELLYCRALAVINCGNTTRGEDFVKRLIALGEISPELRCEALSLMGRIYKVRASRTKDPAVRLTCFRAGFDFYQQAYALSSDTFPGINAASLALLCGEVEQSRQHALKVRNTVLATLDLGGNERDYWLLATLGEAYLLLGDTIASLGRYRQAVRLAREAHSDGDIVSMLRQLMLLKERLPVGEELLSLFRLGPVVVFAGHGLDRPGEPLRFPDDPALEAAVRRAIKNDLDAIEATIGYCSPGCGSDVLFGELMRARDGELHVVLPFAEKDFCHERLTYGLPALEPWQKRFVELRGSLRVTEHFATKEEFLNDQVLYDFSGTFMQGLALTRAALVGVDAIALVVQDLTVQPVSPGLATFVANWKSTGRETRILKLDEIRAGVRLTASPLPPPETPPPPHESQRTVRAMLFADVAGFSNLPERNLPKFFMELLNIVDAELKNTPVLFQNTWGDGLYIVFDNVVTCAEFALRLLRRMDTFDFTQLDPYMKTDDKGVRIGLHTGPVFRGFDAVIKKDNYFGSHVSRAARIEPVTAPGSAFVSEQFAAALALAPGHAFVCEYLGVQPLAKGYDTCPLYRLTVSEVA